MNKITHNSVTIVEFTLPITRRTIEVQPNEKLAIQDILRCGDVKEEDILVSSTDMPEMYYTGIDGLRHRYYPDIYIKRLNVLVEVKGLWLSAKDIEKQTIPLKLLAATQLGFYIECPVYHDKQHKFKAF
jgi:hypothetical protein